jgi:hypothetical protein
MTWMGKLKALYLRHEALVREMASRRYRHNSPLSAKLATGAARQESYVDAYEKQVKIVQSKGCACKEKTMTNISKDSIATLEFRLTWKSGIGSHTEIYLAKHVNLWRDLLMTKHLTLLSARFLLST